MDEGAASENVKCRSNDRESGPLVTQWFDISARVGKKPRSATPGANSEDGMLYEEKGHASSSADGARRPRSAHAVFCDTKPRVSQISCRRFLRECGDSILSLSCEQASSSRRRSAAGAPFPIPSFSCCASISDLSPGGKTRPCRRGLSNGAAESVCRAPFSDRSANNGTSAHQLLAINRLEDGARGGIA